MTAAGESGATVENAPSARYREIVDAAALMFREQGYAQTSVQDVAEAVGLLKGSLYYHIQTKEDLLYSILAEVHADMATIAVEVEEMDASPMARLETYIRRHLLYMSGNMVKSFVYYHELHQLSAERLGSIVAARKAHEDLAIGLITEGQRLGEMDPELDAKVVAFLLFGAMNWACMWYDPAGPVGPEELTENYLRTILRGVANPAA